MAESWWPRTAASPADAWLSASQENRERQLRVECSRDVPHKGSLIRDGVNVGKLALIGRSACEGQFPLTLLGVLPALGNSLSTHLMRAQDVKRPVVPSAPATAPGEISTSAVSASDRGIVRPIGYEPTGVTAWRSVAACPLPAVFAAEGDLAGSLCSAARASHR